MTTVFADAVNFGCSSQVISSELHKEELDFMPSKSVAFTLQLLLLCKHCYVSVCNKVERASFELDSQLFFSVKKKGEVVTGCCFSKASKWRTGLFFLRPCFQVYLLFSLLNQWGWICSKISTDVHVGLKLFLVLVYPDKPHKQKWS